MSHRFFRVNLSPVKVGTRFIYNVTERGLSNVLMFLVTGDLLSRGDDVLLLDDSSL